MYAIHQTYICHTRYLYPSDVHRLSDFRKGPRWSEQVAVDLQSTHSIELDGRHARVVRCRFGGIWWESSMPGLPGRTYEHSIGIEKRDSQLVISPCFILCERINIIVSSTMYNYLLCNPNPKLSKLLYDKWNISKRVHYEYTSFAVHKMGRTKITDICVGLWLITPCGSVDISWYIQHPTVDLLLSYWSRGPRFESQTRDNSNSYGHLLVIYIYITGYKTMGWDTFYFYGGDLLMYL